MYVSRVSLLGLSNVSPGLEPAIEAYCAEAIIRKRKHKAKADQARQLVNGLRQVH